MLITPTVFTRPSSAQAAPPPELKRLECFVDPAQPVGKLPRPVLLIPGGNSRRIGLSAIIHYLTADGHNQFGGPYSVQQRPEFEATYKEHGGEVFCLQFSHQFGGPERNATEIKQAIDDLRRLTGHDEIDIVAECKGAMEFLHYIDQGHDGVRNVLLVVPPGRGMPGLGDLLKVASRAIEKLKLPVSRVGEVKIDPESLQGLRNFGTQISVGGWHNNPVMRSINSPEGIERQKQAIHSLTVLLGDGRKLNLMEELGLPGAPLPLYRGDGWVPRWSGYMAHAQNFAYTGERAKHGEMATNGKALAKIAEALQNDGKVTRDENFLTKPPPSMPQVALRTALGGAALAGHLVTLGYTVVGASLGPLGLGLAGLSAGVTAFDGVVQARHAVQGREPGLKATLGAASRLAQTAGLLMALSGTGGWAPAVLIGGGLVVSTWSWT